MKKSFFIAIALICYSNSFSSNGNIKIFKNNIKDTKIELLRRQPCLIIYYNIYDYCFQHGWDDCDSAAIAQAAYDRCKQG